MDTTVRTRQPAGSLTRPGITRWAAYALAGVVAFGALGTIQRPWASGSTISYAHSAAAKVAKWEKITPPHLNMNPSAFGGGNYGLQAIAVDQKSGAVYVGTCNQGLWKSTNQGKTWTKINTGTGGNLLDAGRLWALSIDPVDPKVLYTTAGYGGGGVLKSTDGGVSWTNMLPAGSDTYKLLQTADVASLEIDPANHEHIIASFHNVFAGSYSGRGPVIESLDGGSTWKIHSVSRNIGYPQYVHFLGSSSSWLLASAPRGYWRTTDGGHHWTQVSTAYATDGGNQLYHAANGVWYTSSSGSILRSSTGGRTWQSVRFDASPTMGIIGDGKRLYTATAVTGGSPTNRIYYYSSPEKRGKHWTRYGSQTFSDGPMVMAYDRARHVIYSSNWRAGAWKLHVS